MEINEKQVVALGRLASKAWVFEGKTSEGCITPGLAETLVKLGLAKKDENRTWSASMSPNGGSFRFRPTYKITELGRTTLAARLLKVQESMMRGC